MRGTDRMNKFNKLKLIIVGHVDHGKSSLIGRLLCDTNSIAQDKITEMELISKKLGHNVEYAYLLDHLQEEREQGITIDTTQTFFKTKKRDYVIIDAPGHVEFIKNMITGASQADAAVLIIDASEGIQEQTKRHAFILSMLGLEQIIVVINKMDLVDQSKSVFDDIVSNLGSFLSSINLNITYAIPISAMIGDNIVNKSTNIPWYEGKTVLEALDSLDNKQDNMNDLPILPIQDVYKVNNKRIAVGKLETGRLKTEEEILILPTMQKTNIKTFEKFLEDIKECEAGDCFGITTEDPLFIERGSIVCTPDTKAYVTDCFEASLFWMSKDSLKVGEKVVLRCVTQEVPCVIKEIHKKVNSSTLMQIKGDLSVQNTLEVCHVTVKTKKPIAVCKFNIIQALGRFVIVKNNMISGGGIINSLS